MADSAAGARLLVINADDFGLSPGVSDGIIEAHTRGVVTSTSLMVNRPGAAYAAQLAAGHPALSVGIHFEDDHESDLDAPAQARAAFAAQLASFRELTGQDPTHIDSHHHVHLDAGSAAVFGELAAELGVPLRRDGQVSYVGDFWARDADERLDLAFVSRGHLVELIRSTVDAGWTEIACHPARLTGDFTSSYHDERRSELETLTSPGLRGVRLVSYRDWPAA